MINRNFTLLWIGKITSQLGDKFYAIGLAWWILKKTNSPSLMGLFLLTSILPSIILGLFAGVIADRWKRKNILIATEIINGGLVLIISCLAKSNALEIWHVFAIAFCLSLVNAFFDPAVQAIIPEIVEKNNLNKANGINQIIDGICTIVGPLFGAVAVSMFGLAWVSIVNSISYFLSALLTSFIRTNRDYRDFNEKSFIWKDLQEGIDFLRGQRRIRLVLKIVAVAHFFLGSLVVSLPFLANGLAGKGVNNLAYLEMMMGVGLIFGSVFIGSRKKTDVNERNLIFFMITFGCCFFIISVFQFLSINTIYVYLGLMGVIGACIALSSVLWRTLLQIYTPENMTGRIFSITSLVGDVSLPIAYGIFGFLLGSTSIFIVMGVCGVCLISLCFYLLLREKSICKKVL